MKLVSVAAPALAVTIVPLVADNAAAYSLQNPSTESVKAGLRVAICNQDWAGATELAGGLIASPDITPEHRQTLVDWRHRFSSYSKGQVKFDNMSNCEGVQIAVKPYQTPRFSNSQRLATSPCYMDMGGVRTDLSHMCQPSVAVPVIAAAPEPVVAGASIIAPAQQQPAVNPTMFDIAGVQWQSKSGRTKAEVLIRFDRKAPDTARASFTVTGDGQQRGGSVSRADGRVQRVEVYFQGRVSSSAIEVSGI